MWVWAVRVKKFFFVSVKITLVPLYRAKYTQTTKNIITNMQSVNKKIIIIVIISVIFRVIYKGVSHEIVIP
ncbi:hypothetical protein HpSIM16_15150 [Helicobacter pylori]